MIEKIAAAILSANGRRTIYSVAIAGVALLAIYGKINSDQSAAWLAFVASVLGVAGPVTALMHITPDPEKPEVEE